MKATKSAGSPFFVAQNQGSAATEGPQKLDTVGKSQKVDKLDKGTELQGSAGLKASAKRHSLPGLIQGFIKPAAAAAVLLAASLPVAAQGVPLDEVQVKSPTEYSQSIETHTVSPGEEAAQGNALELGSTVIQFSDVSPDRLNEFEGYVRALERMLEQGSINTGQYAQARRNLWAEIVDGVDMNLARKPNGKVDLEALTGSVPVGTADERTQLRFERLATDLERRMRITARDFASPDSYAEVEGAPGYKELPGDEVLGMITDALQEIPIKDLPVGHFLRNVVEALPNTQDIENIQDLTFEELKDEVGDAQRDWLEAKVGPYFEEHKVKATILGFAAITGLRASSPEAADVMDEFKPRVRVFRERYFEDQVSAQGLLTYRDQQVLPDLDFEATARGNFGPAQLRATFKGTASLEAEEHFTGTATIGANYQSANWWLDGNMSHDIITENSHLTIKGGGTHHPTDTTFGGALHYDQLRDGGEDSLSLGLDTYTPIELGDSQGEVTFFAGFNRNLDTDDTGFKAALLFRLRF